MLLHRQLVGDYHNGLRNTSTLSLDSWATVAELNAMLAAKMTCAVWHSKQGVTQHGHKMEQHVWVTRLQPHKRLQPA